MIYLAFLIQVGGISQVFAAHHDTVAVQPAASERDQKRKRFGDNEVMDQASHHEGRNKTCGAHDCITFNASYSIIAATKWQRASYWLAVRKM